MEDYQILRALLGITSGWTNHPAVRMWKGHEEPLLVYGTAICEEWKRRGFKNQIFRKLWRAEIVNQIPIPLARRPGWAGDPDFHRSHQSNLLRKDPEWYGQFGWDVPDDLPYVWPV